MADLRRAPTVHRCAVPVCGTPIERGKLMCREHWHMVPKALQRAVSRAWRRFAGGRTPQDRAAALGSYRGAVADAVAAVERALP